MPRQRRNVHRRNTVLDGASVPAEPTDYSAMSTEALRLLLGERHLQQTGNRRELISRLQFYNEQQRPPASQSAGAQSNSSIATGVPHAKLAALIASIVDERMNRQLIQDGGASSAQLPRPSPPSTLQDSLRSSPPPPPQDGGQNTTQQQPSFQNPPTGNLLPSTAVSSGLAASSGLGSLSSPVDFSDPAQVASLHPNFRQPSLASHLTKATSTAITNGEYVDFATLLPMTSLLTDSIHSHLNLKVGDQGITIPLPSSSKRPKITSIDRWLDAFAIYFAVIASPNQDADLAAALIIFLIPALYLPVGPGMPLPNPTCATTLTKADPVLAPHALTNTSVTSRDAQQLTLGKITPNSPATERTDLNRLQALAIPPEDTPNYLSQLTPPTPIDINKFAFYLQGHPDHTTVNHLLTGFSQGFKIGYSGPRAPKEYSNLPCANINPSIIDKNMLKEV
ncbi:unnamed protein product, partial [Porites lobata]